MTSTVTAPTTRLAALQAYDRHVSTCVGKRAGAVLLLDDGYQPTLTDTCPIADALWSTVCSTPA